MRKNLQELLGEYRIEIPMLQRDYAQGRVSQNKIANEFLTSIFEVLNGKRPSLHVDFIYGYKENDKFLLIDGQQRVTTLWLLHFYLYKKAGCLEEIKGLLEKFSYNTRKNSKKFCKNLLKKDFDLGRKPSEAIKNQGGEFESAENLNNDPTIKAMLHMLDLISERVQDAIEIEVFTKNLGNITFDIFDMGEFKLGEELYIKMNARGKPLSAYENLKSFIEKDFDISRDQRLLVSIDNEWSDYFFDGKEPEKFDTRGCYFLHYATLFFVLENEEKLDKSKFEEIIKNPNQPVDEFYKPLQDIENIKLLDRTIKLCLSFDELKTSETFETLKLKDSSFFDEESNGSLTYLKICYFLSLLCYMKENTTIEESDKIRFNDYLRVSRHFIENHRLDSPDNIKSFYRLFKHLSQGHKNIYQFLVENPTYSFHSNIYHLEARKAKLILMSRGGGEDWESILNQTSEHKILKGWVDFLLDFSDEAFDYEELAKVDFRKYKGYEYYYRKNNQILENPNLERFQQYANLTMKILDKDFTLFQRAFFCIGDFGLRNTNWFYGNSPTDNIRDREAMIQILRGNNEKSSQLPYFKKFLDALLKSTKEDLKDKMEEIIEQTDLLQKEWWEQLLIGEEELFKFLNKTKQGRLRDLEKINKLELLPGLKSRIGVKDLFDYGFYCYCRKNVDHQLSVYCDEEQRKDQYSLVSHFSLYGIEVLCDSVIPEYNKENKIPYIRFGNQSYDIELLKKGINIFDEFDRVLKCIKESLEKS